MVTVAKTAVTVLQELMVKLKLTPEYECIAQSGPMHLAKFEYRCVALGVVVTALAHSKKEAKQEAARIMLEQLAARGHSVPPPYGCAVGAKPLGPGPGPGPAPGPAPSAPGPSGAAGPGAADARSYVALLKELCEDYKLPGVEYELVGDTGPPHLRHFTYKARMGLHERIATATTKKAARQLAAEQLFSFLRENLARVTQDFDEEDALVRANQRAMERILEPRDEAAMARRPDLGQKFADYHLGIVMQTDPDQQAAALAALEAGRAGSPQRVLAEVAAALGLTLESAGEPEDVGLALLELTSTAPELMFAGDDADEAATAALRYLQLALAQPRPAPASLLD